MSARAAVNAALKAKMEGLGYTVLEQRDEEDAITESELPAVLIQQAGTIEVSQRDGAERTLEHQGAWFLSFAAKTQAEAETMFSAGAAALSTDFVLGGSVQEIVPVSWGDEDNDGRDLTAILLEIQITFCTSTDDWNTLI